MRQYENRIFHTVYSGGVFGLAFGRVPIEMSRTF